MVMFSVLMGSFLGVECFLVMMVMVYVYILVISCPGVGYMLFGEWGYDVISLFMVGLSVYIISVSVLASFKVDNFKWIIVCFGVMVSSLMVLFVSSSFLVFYVVYELVVLVLIIMLINWGANPERFKSLVYLIIYMMVFSMPMFFVLMIMVSSIGVSSFSVVICVSVFMEVLVVMAMLVKIPMYLFHFWLPKVHVEASTGLSMVLAGVLLKMGAYGLYRFVMMWNLNLCLLSIVTSLSLVGMVAMSLVCVYVSDLKELVAYSSVVHMSLMVVVLVNMGMAFFVGVLAMMVFHGFVSALMFFLVGKVYELSGSRSIMVNKGLVSMYGFLGVLFFLVLIMNMGFPFSGNFVAEIQLIGYVVGLGVLGVVLSVLYVFFSCVYSVLMYTYIMTGGELGENWSIGFGVSGWLGVLMSMEFMVYVLVYL
nr:NADH dehydrogenase subunit 4 [Moniliformis sp. XH-2020]